MATPSSPSSPWSGRGSSIDLLRSSASQGLDQVVAAIRPVAKAMSPAVRQWQEETKNFSIPALVHGKFEKSKLVGIYRGVFAERYEVLRELGAGAGGVAMLVRPKEGPESKVLVAKKAHGDDSRELREEFKWMKKLRHPNVVKVTELIEGDVWKDDHYTHETLVVTEYACGKDLFKYTRVRLEAGVVMTEGWIAKVLKEAIQGVAYLHSLSIIHNDIKPDNILMMDEFSALDPSNVPRVVITDFGRAQQGYSQHQLGDPRYQSPQKWRLCRKDFVLEIADEDLKAIDESIDPNTDVWSLGVTLFELLSGGKIAFLYQHISLEDFFKVDKDTGTNEAMQTMGHGVLGAEPIDLAHCVGVSDDARELLLAMFAKATKSRPSASEVLKYAWFRIEGRKLDPQLLSSLQVTAIKGMAHSIALEAMVCRLKRDHCKNAEEIFHKIDEDHDGHVSLTELEQAFKQLNRDPKDAAQVFRSVDTDQTRHLDVSEFLVATFDWKAIHEDELREHILDFFRSLDADNDGSIDLPELSTLFDGALTKSEIEETFKLMDMNKDGVISLEELERFLFEPMSEEELKLYAAAMSGGTVELCEKIQPESLASLGCCSLGCYVGCHPLGVLACLSGCLAGVFRWSKTRSGRNFFERHGLCQKPQGPT